MAMRFFCVIATARSHRAPNGTFDALDHPSSLPHPKYYEETRSGFTRAGDPTIQLSTPRLIPSGSLALSVTSGCARYIGSLRRSTNLYLARRLTFSTHHPFQLCRFAGSTLYRKIDSVWHRLPGSVVHVWPGSTNLQARPALVSLGTWLEPWAVKNAALITG